MEMRWKVGSLGREVSIADVAVAVAAPMMAEVQLQLTMFSDVECGVWFQGERERLDRGLEIVVRWQYWSQNMRDCSP